MKRLLTSLAIMLVIGATTGTSIALEENKLERLERLESRVQTNLQQLQEIEIDVQDYSEADLYWLSRIVSAEAKGEPIKGQMAVANVVLNRVESENFPNTIKEVVFQKGQFCPVTSGSIYDKPYDSAIESATRVLKGERVLEDDVLYFYNPKVVSRGSWIRTRPTAKDIGNHRFAK